MIIIFPRRFSIIPVEVSPPVFDEAGALVRPATFRPETDEEYEARKAGPDRRVSILTPADEYVQLVGIDAIAQKDVPFGAPYKLIERTDVPEDRQGWVLEDGVYTDGFGLESHEFPLQAQQAPDASADVGFGVSP